MGLEAILGIVGGILAIVSAVFGTKFNKAKKVASSAIDVADRVMESLEDDNVTKEEARDIMRGGKQVIDEGKKVLKKK